MKNLLKYETRKLFRQTSFIVCTILAIIFTILIGNVMMEFLMSEITEWDYYMMERMLQSIGCNSIDLLITILITIFICSDFTSRVIKNIIGRGYTRAQVYIAKYIISVFIAVLFSAIALLATWIYNTISSYSMEWTGEIVILLLEQVLGQILYATIFFFVSIMMKKTGGAIFVNILVPSGITTALDLIDYFLMERDMGSVSQFWPLSYLPDFMYTGVESADFVKFTLLSFGFIVVLFSIGFMVFRKQDV